MMPIHQNWSIDLGLSSTKITQILWYIYKHQKFIYTYIYIYIFVYLFSLSKSKLRKSLEVSGSIGFIQVVGLSYADISP